jgi:mono/diheme cytochrome c family protein
MRTEGAPTVLVLRRNGRCRMAAARVGLMCLLGLGCSLMGAAPAEPAAAEDPRADQVLAEMGSELYLQYCASCHGVDGQGRGPVAGALKVRPADLTRIAVRREGIFPDGEVARFIDGRFVPASHGTRDMPVWGARFGERVPEAGLSEEITRGRVLVLLEYLKSIQASD